MLPVARLAYKTVGALNAALRHWVVLHSVAHVKREVPRCLRVIEPLSGNTKLAHGRSRSGSLAIFAAVRRQEWHAALTALAHPGLRSPAN